MAGAGGRAVERTDAPWLLTPGASVCAHACYRTQDHYAKLAVDAVLRLKGKPNLDYIQVIHM